MNSLSVMPNSDLKFSSAKALDLFAEMGSVLCPSTQSLAAGTVTNDKIYSDNGPFRVANSF